ncbi:hypothetical protein DFS34DRAFT_600123 [Phlyctochytrium arcticum]|nr:hypothetical protein DFS34DRAFT_600123 [Phlyctochytrium arcticum]
MSKSHPACSFRPRPISIFVLLHPSLLEPTRTTTHLLRFLPHKPFLNLDASDTGLYFSEMEDQIVVFAFSRFETSFHFFIFEFVVDGYIVNNWFTIFFHGCW